MITNINWNENNVTVPSYNPSWKEWAERWLYSTNCKEIAILYLLFAVFSSLVGTGLSILIRLELAAPNSQILYHNGQVFNVIISAHAIFMIFFFVMPITMGFFANYLVPLMIGAIDMSFPRINNVAFWLLVPSLLLAVSSTLVDNGPGTGWTVEKLGLCCFKISFDTWKTIYIIILEYLVFIFNYVCLLKYSIINYIKSVKKFNTNSLHVSLLLTNKLQRLNMIKWIKFIRFFKINKLNSINFEEWLVGITDGDGTFNVYTNIKNKKIIFTYKISLYNRNIQLLYKIKSYLGVGSVTRFDKNSNMIDFKIRDKNSLLNVIIPLFDKYPLLTTKRFHYLIFKTCLLISNNKNLSQLEKIDLINKLKDKEPNNNYMSDAWDSIRSLVKINEAIKDKYNYINISHINNIMSKSWLIGFIEAEGSFYIVKKDHNRYVHAFGITQKLDYIILYSIKLILKIPSSIRDRKRYYIIETTNSKNIEYIINYFTYNDFKSYMSGMKNYEFSLWKNSFMTYKNNKTKLIEVRDKIRNFRKVKLNL